MHLVGQKFIPIFHMRYPTNEINHSSSNVLIKRGHESADSKSENSLKQEFEWLFDKFL